MAIIGLRTIGKGCTLVQTVFDKGTDALNDIASPIIDATSNTIQAGTETVSASAALMLAEARAKKDLANKAETKEYLANKVQALFEKDQVEEMSTAFSCKPEEILTKVRENHKLFTSIQNGLKGALNTPEESQSEEENAVNQTEMNNLRHSSN